MRFKRNNHHHDKYNYNTLVILNLWSHRLVGRLVGRYFTDTLPTPVYLKQITVFTREERNVVRHLCYRRQRENTMVFCKKREVYPTVSSFFTIIHYRSTPPLFTIIHPPFFTIPIPIPTTHPNPLNAESWTTFKWKTIYSNETQQENICESLDSWNYVVNCAFCFCCWLIHLIVYVKSPLEYVISRRRPALPCTALYCTALHCTVLHYTYQ